MTMEVAQLLRDAGPWGQMFPEPLFDGHFRLLQQRLVGERHLKVMVEPVGGGPLLDGIALMSIPPSGRITACVKCNWLISSISTSFAATAACKLSSTISGQFSVIFSIKKSVDWVHQSALITAF
ncbi:hypothetical protein ACVXG9_19250 [Escherichia coli]